MPGSGWPHEAAASTPAPGERLSSRQVNPRRRPPAAHRTGYPCTIGRIQTEFVAQTRRGFGDRVTLRFFNISFVFLAVGIVLIGIGAWVGWVSVPPEQPTKSPTE